MNKPTLSDTRQLCQDVWTYEEEDVKEFIKELIEVSKENDWEVAVDDNHEDGFRIISGEDWIKEKVGEKLK
jgi:hypothetical protein